MASERPAQARPEPWACAREIGARRFMALASSLGEPDEAVTRQGGRRATEGIAPTDAVDAARSASGKDKRVRRLLTSRISVASGDAFPVFATELRMSSRSASASAFTQPELCRRARTPGRTVLLSADKLSE